MNPHLQQRLTLFGLTMIAVGSCIGSGIFVTPGQIVKEVQHPALVILAWIIGGTISLTGALTFSEMGSLFPRSGGIYVFLKEAYGPLPAFLYGWVTLLVINTGALAGLSVAFAEYSKVFWPTMTESGKMILAGTVMVVLTLINGFGVHLSQHLANFFTALKLLAILGIIIVGFMVYDPQTIPLDFSFRSGSMPSVWFGSLVLALVGVNFSVGGWHHATFVAGETINAARNVPRAMIYGVFIVTAMYLLINLAYMFMLPLSEIALTDRIAGVALSNIVPWGGQVASVAIMLSILGTISIYSMSAPRIYFAMAQDQIFFPALSKIHHRWHTPLAAMLFQVFWALLILFFFQGYFNKIITFVTFVDALFFALGASTIFYFRKHKPDLPRPVRTWGYPLVPLIFVMLQTVFAFYVLKERPAQALPGLILIGVGLLAFAWFKKRQKPTIN